MAGEAERGLGVRRPEVILNGLDLEWFDRVEPVDVRASYALPRNVPIVLFTGRMERRKGVHLFPEMAERLLTQHSVAFVLAGADPFGFVRERLLPKFAGRALKGSLHWLDAVPQRDIRALVRGADVFVSPSLWENCPYSVLEAMAAGRAVVAADQGGTPELIQHGVSGLLAATNDAGSFARSIGELLDDPPQRARLGTAARRTVESAHRAEATARHTVGVYQRAISQYQHVRSVRL
jgi:glycosyltransferase involved in cell wall biosynthesis